MRILALLALMLVMTAIAQASPKDDLQHTLDISSLVYANYLTGAKNFSISWNEGTLFSYNESLKLLNLDEATYVVAIYKLPPGAMN